MSAYAYGLVGRSYPTRIGGELKLLRNGLKKAGNSFFFTFMNLPEEKKIFICVLVTIAFWTKDSTPTPAAVHEMSVERGRKEGNSYSIQIF